MVKKLLKNSIKDFNVSKNIQQRGIGDEIEARIINKLSSKKEYSEPSGKKSTGDFSLNINNENNMIDIKSHNVDSDMSMPNLISISKLDKIIDNNEKLYYNIISYKVVEHDNFNEVKIINNHVLNIYELNVEKLSIGNLGNGQLQIKNLNNNDIETNYDKDKFINGYKKLKKEFYNKQINKFTKKLNELEGEINWNLII